MVTVEKLVTDHLDLWASAIKRRSTAGRGSSKKVELYGVKKLRELILELAVRGLLVPQDPKDEPASELFKKIVAEKARLVKEGGKKGKLQPPMGDEEKPFSLPKGWTWVRNAGLFSLRKGKVPKDLSESGAIPYLDIEALDRGNVRRYTNDTSILRAMADDLLVVCDGSRSGLVLDGKDGAIGSTLSVIETSKLVQSFVKLLFMHGFERLNSTMKGAAIPHLDTAKLLSEITGLPPLPEQHRIIAKVDELMALCDQLEQQTDASLSAHQTLVETVLNALANAADHAQFASAWQRIAEHFDTLFTSEESIDQFKQTILQLAVMGKLVPQDLKDEPASELLKKITDEKSKRMKEGKIKRGKQLLPIAEEEKPFVLPAGWEWCRLLQATECEREISYGIIKLEAEPASNGIPTLRCSDVKPGYIRTNDVRTVTPEIEEPYKRTRLRGGEILVNIRGTLGGAALVPMELAGYNIAREVAMLPIHSLIVGRYLVAAILSPFFWNMIESNLKGIAYKGLSLELLSQFAIPIPPLCEQHRIVAKVDELIKLCDQLKTHLSNAQSIQLHLTDALAEKVLGRV